MTRFAIAILTFVGTLLLGSLTSAQDAGARDEEARQYFEAGRAAYTAGDFVRALEQFERAYELSQRELLLFNIANAHDRLRHDQEALVYFQRFLDAVPTGENADFARARVAALSESSAPTPLEPPEPSEPTTDRSTENDESPPVSSAAGAGDPIPGIAFLAAGGALFVGGIGTLVWAVDRNSAIDACNDVGCLNGPTLVAERDAAVATTVTLGVLGAAGLVTGAVLLVLSEDTGSASVACAPSFTGLGCTGRFH